MPFPSLRSFYCEIIKVTWQTCFRNKTDRNNYFEIIFLTAIIQGLLIIKISAFIWELLVCSIPYQQIPEVCGLEVLQGFIEGDYWGWVQVLSESWWILHKKWLFYNSNLQTKKQSHKMFYCETGETSNLVGRSPEPPTPVGPFPTPHFLLYRSFKK